MESVYKMDLVLYKSVLLESLQDLLTIKGGVLLQTHVFKLEMCVCVCVCV
jgi:hypothetical protein